MNVDEMERGQRDDANEGEDERLLSSYWQARVEQLEAEAARVKQLEEELERERNQRELSERKQRKLRKELLRTKESTSGLLTNAEEGTQAHHPIVDHLDSTRLSAMCRPRPDEGLVARNLNRTLNDQPPRGSSFLDEKQAIANRGPRKNAGRPIGPPSVEGGQSILNEKIAMADRGSKERRSLKMRATPKGTSDDHSGRGSFMNLKLDMANRRSGKKSSSAGDAAGELEQTIDNWPEGGSAENRVSVSSPPHYNDGQQSTAGIAMLSMDGVDPSESVPTDANKDNTQRRWEEETNVEESKTVDPQSNATYVVKRSTAGHNLHPVPGAVAVFPSHFIPRGSSLVEEELTMPEQINAAQSGHEDPLVAHLVEEPSPLPTTRGTVINTKRRRLMNVLRALSLAAVVATITSIAVVYTRPGGNTVTVSSQSPTSSLEPSVSPSLNPTSFPTMAPSLFPSASPSTGLFGFLAEYGSFDNGTALATPGSPQQKAMDWLNTSALLDYELLQTYVLATLYYSTLGNQWTSSSAPFYSSQFLSSYNWCLWQGVSCNNNGDIEALQLSSNRLFGSIPAELAVLDQSLSEIRK